MRWGLVAWSILWGCGGNGVVPDRPDADVPAEGAPDAGTPDAPAPTAPDAQQPPACYLEGTACYFYESAHADATQRDIDSWRMTVQRYCYRQDENGTWGTTYTIVEDCDYSEICREAACLSCGVYGNRYEYSVVDDEVREDCVGCECDDRWSVFDCWGPGQGPYDQTSFLLNWFSPAGFQGLYYFTPGLSYLGPDYGAGFSVSIAGSADVSPGGLIDVEISVHHPWKDNWGVVHDVTSNARVVAYCPN